MWKDERERLIAGSAPTQTLGKKARGLPTTEKKGQVPTDRLPDPKGLKEGQTAGGGKYIVTNGIWMLAK